MIPLPILLVICLGQIIFAENLANRVASSRIRVAAHILAGVFVVEALAISAALVADVWLF